MLLTYYKTIFPKSFTVKIELTADEVLNIDRKEPYKFDTELLSDGLVSNYLTTNGAVSLCAVDADGKEHPMTCYSEEGLKKIYENEYKKILEKKGEQNDYTKSVKDYLATCYAMGQDNSIKMYGISSQTTQEEYVYKNGDIKSTKVLGGEAKEELITLDYLTPITQYGTPMEFLVAILEIGQSRDFIDEFIKLIDDNTQIKIGVYNIKTTSVEKIITDFNKNIKVEGKKDDILYEVKNTKGEVLKHTEEKIEGKEEVNITIRANEDCEVILYENGQPEQTTEIIVTGSRDWKEVTKDMVYSLNESNNWTKTWTNKSKPSQDEKNKEDTGKAQHIIIREKEENKYDVEIIEVKTWCQDIIQENKISTINNMYTLNQDEEVSLIIEESDLIVTDKENEKKEYTKEKNSSIFRDNDKYKEDLKTGEEGFLNSLFNYTIRKKEKNYDYGKYNFTKMNIENTNVTESTLINTSETQVINGVPKVIDKTDLFVDLLKENNKPKKYKSIYSGDSKVGDLLVNGDEMLFTILDSTYTEDEICNTRGLSDVMKVILYKYSGNDYGITELSFSIFDMKGMSAIGGTVLGGTIEEKVWYSLRNIGFSEEAVAAAMGNIYAESGFNPELIEKGSGVGFGLCQWSYGRRTSLENYAIAKGVEPSDIYTQIEFLMAELTPGGGANGYAKYQLQATTYTGTTYKPEDWINATNIEDATKAFCFTFERPNFNKAHVDVRIKKAKEYYETFKGKTISDIAEINEIQLAIVEIAQNSSKYGIATKKDRCLAWVNDVYTKAGATVERKDCAFCSGYNFGVSKDFSIIPLGAAVYGESPRSEAGRKYGHVGIYIGNGLVADNVGRVRIMSLEEWIKSFPNGCWGWTSSTPVNRLYNTTKGLIHAGRHN